MNNFFNPEQYNIGLAQSNLDEARKVYNNMDFTNEMHNGIISLKVFTNLLEKFMHKDFELSIVGNVNESVSFKSTLIGYDANFGLMNIYHKGGTITLKFDENLDVKLIPNGFTLHLNERIYKLQF